MAEGQPVSHSGHEHEDARGVLFRIGATIALVVFAGVLALGLARGMDPTIALVRALVALLVITGLGWSAEAIAGAARVPPRDPEPEPAPQSEAWGGVDESNE
jgi:hypothetical protein